MTGPPYLFVYGTLRAATGNKWSDFLASVSVSTGQGRTRGLLYRLDGYPGMIVRPEEDVWVRGDLHRLNDPQSALSSLDDYEGCGPASPPPYEFEREIVRVRLDDGVSLDAWAYVYRWSTNGRERIVSGDYLLPG